MKSLKLNISGTRPLLMHSDILSDPLNPLTKAHKELTGKRKKTDDDQEAIAKSEWRSSIYWNETDGPFIPGINIHAAIVDGGKLSKLGTQLKRSTEILEEICPLVYDGPKDIEGLWRSGFYDARSVKIQKARLTRYRPIFLEWQCFCELIFDEESIDESSVIKSAKDAGMYCGIGDFRPRFGRFDVEVVA